MSTPVDINDMYKISAEWTVVDFNGMCLFFLQNEIVLVNVLIDHDYKPLQSGKKKINNEEHYSSLWEMNIWDQRSMQSFLTLTP